MMTISTTRATINPQGEVTQKVTGSSKKFNNREARRRFAFVTAPPDAEVISHKADSLVYTLPCTISPGWTFRTSVSILWAP